MQSEYGKGSVFAVSLRQRIIDDKPMGDFAGKYRSFMNEKKGTSINLHIPEAEILVVDDIEMNMRVACGMLKKTGGKIDKAYSGKECLDLIYKKHYDIIFLDHMMPELDGVETIAIMKAKKDHLNTDTPVIVLTANAVVGAREEYLKHGFADYLSKPIHLEDLIELLYRYLPKERIETSEPKNKDNTGSHRNMDEGLKNQFPMLDIEKGLTFCMNDEEFYVEMIETYLEGDKREVINQMYESEDWKNYENYVHALKSTSLNIGAVVLSEQAKALEFAAKDGNYEYIKEHNEEVMAEYSRLLEQISERL